MRMAANPYFSLGSKIYGQGFLFAPNDPASFSLEDRDELLRRSPALSERILPYLVGEEILSSPNQEPRRFAIFLSDIQTEKELDNYPELKRLVEEKVKPERMKLGENPNNIPLKKRWWAYQAHRPELYQRIRSKKRVLCVSRVGKHVAFDFFPSSYIFSEAVVVLDDDSLRLFGSLQSQTHAIWVFLQCSTLEDRIRYTPSDCFETFPLPAALLDTNSNDPTHESVCEILEVIGERYQQFRSELILANNEGLTSTYNRFHDPAETSSGLQQLRVLHQEMDQVLLAAYSWSDVPTACGFGLDYLDTEDDAQLPDALQERIDSGELFFWDAGDALDFQSQLQAYGAITGRRKLPWRFRWPDAVRDDVLARLLALNAERYAEEQILGKKSGRAPRRSSRSKPIINTSTAAFPMPGDVQVDLFQPNVEQLEFGR
jgi:hypothetical protein